MKKFLLVCLFAVLSLLSCFTFKANAEEVPTEPQTEETTPQQEEEFDFSEWLQETINPETIIAVINAPITLAIVCFLIKLLKKAKNQEQITAKEVGEDLKKVIETANKDTLDKAMKDLIDPLLAKIEKNDKILNGFAKVLVLTQENTAESRVASLQVLQDLGNIEVKVIEQANQEIEKQIEERDKVDTENKEILDNVIKGRC